MAASARRRATGRPSTASVEALRKLEPDETLLIQSGKPVGVFRTHERRPARLDRELQTSCRSGATWEHFRELDRKGLMMYGQMTAGSWIYIGSPGHRAGHLRDLRRNGPQALRRRSVGPLDSHGRSRRHGWGATAGRDDGRCLHARHRMPAQPDRKTPRNQVSRRRHRQSRRSAAADRQIRPRQAALSVGLAGKRGGDPARARQARHQAGCGHTTRPARTIPSTAICRKAGRSPNGKSAAPRSRKPSPRPRASRSPGTCAPCWRSRARTFPPSTTATTSARWRRTRAWRTPSISPASCRPMSARCSAAASARSAGRRCRATRKTSIVPTKR